MIYPPFPNQVPGVKPWSLCQHPQTRQLISWTGTEWRTVIEGECVREDEVTVIEGGK